MVEEFSARGIAVGPGGEALRNWVQLARPYATAALNNPPEHGGLDCEGTWFVGLNALPNDPMGRVGGSDGLDGILWGKIAPLIGPFLPLHKAQVSVVFPGYPRPRQGETEASFRFRKVRDSAHVDGLVPVGVTRRRFILEPHAFILGIPLNDVTPETSPLVIWEGSHNIIGSAFRKFHKDAQNTAPELLDVTDVYQSARREIFDSCKRIEITPRAGDWIVLHRHLLHGIKAWGATKPESGTGRMIAYFRPELIDGAAAWIANT